MRDATIIAILGVFGAGIILVVVFALANPFTTPKIPTVSSVDSSKLNIDQSEAEMAARDHLDRLAQGNGQQAAVYRGGTLGSADLIFVDKDGTNYIVDKEDGKLGEKLPFPIAGSNPNQYIWKITLNLGNSTKPEYIYVVDGNNGTAWMIGVID